MATTKLTAWGNSYGIRIPKALLKALDWQPNTELSLSLDHDQLIIQQLAKVSTVNQPLDDQLINRYFPIPDQLTGVALIDGNPYAYNIKNPWQITTPQYAKIIAVNQGTVYAVVIEPPADITQALNFKL
ncbi:AbrB/MazE/SpoVT family DNA-binding domain-containing protein [Secundilactobacillus kimchicus]|uniref:SpoVT-AbrB domain-containing protein n=1 Tax=Secundilactobacillus kimchicus JCM 15530 TaxID=1302272 RepID=A0A0R1HQB1_9LACO|nr:AbrB/MazE/SpoVT family DNA-binding domain-containing protein [Secundilactobacillus kimchicus]KRK48832.1 hypothetical protein FC96_GL001153 [Secundilactobacillus kimchicus JCM 15530]MBT9671959.1 AbrB/MazE/SpoVT family DNA-binding domain-containing protein [Secundilactobacillus kimchicus]